MPPPFAQPFPIPYQKIYLYICSIKMCYWRRVRNIYTRCGHGVNLPEEEIKCDLVNCKFSPAHRPNCPNCSQTCWQYRQYPQQYSPHIDRLCPTCSANTHR
ncbi:hypothetical protein C8R42DRAFT_45518 [Lentinula raphanica]|nr:hypothetical protein C8R42DRAFT_45518 [Lentinula raphanica]